MKKTDHDTETVLLPAGTMAAIEQVFLKIPEVRAYLMMSHGKIVSKHDTDNSLGNETPAKT